MNSKISIAILDDHELFSQGLKSLLESEAFSDSITCCNNSEAFYELLDKNIVDLLLLDLNLSEENGLELISSIKEIAPDIKIIILTSYDNNQFSSYAIKSGVDAYVLKDFTKEDLINTIKLVLEGNTVKLNESSAGYKKNKNLKINIHFLDDFLKRHRLTRREVDIISLIAQGYTNKKIADLFHISDNTVKTHRKNIKRKLKFSSTADIVKFAFETGLTN